MKEIIVNESKHRLWVAMRLGLGADAFPRCCGSVGVEEDGQILAAAVYTDYQVFPYTKRSSCWASIAGMPNTNWCTPKFVKAILSYPFDALGVCVLRTMCAKRNKAARNFNEKLGLKRTGTARRSWDGNQDAVHYDLLPHEAAKWLGYEPTAWKEEPKEEADGIRR